MHMGFDITDVKFLKFTANRLNPFVVIKEQKKTLPLFHTLWHQGPTGTLHITLITLINNFSIICYINVFN